MYLLLLCQHTAVSLASASASAIFSTDPRLPRRPKGSSSSVFLKYAEGEGVDVAQAVVLCLAGIRLRAVILPVAGLSVATDHQGT